MSTVSAMAKTSSAARQLKEQLINFIDDITEICPNDYHLPIIRAVVYTSFEANEIADSFVEHVLPFEKHIKARNVDFFEKNDHIFGPLPQDKVEHFRTLWFSGHFDINDKTVIWDYFSVFIDLCKKHQACNQIH